MKEGRRGDIKMVKITLAAARKNKGLSQTEAALHLGVSLSTVKNWELGITFPDQPAIDKICALYEIPYDGLNFLPNKLA